MSQKIEVIKKKRLKQILLICIASFIFIATLGLGLGLGFGTGSKSDTPAEALQNENRVLPRGVTQVSAGVFHTVAIDSQGNLWTFGYNGYGELGNMATTDTNSTPINITAQPGNPLNGKQIVQVSGGRFHTVAIDSQGNLWAFGAGSNGQLGNMSTTDSSTPINITAQSGNPLNGKQIVQVSAGDYHTIIIDSQGNLWTFGGGYNGELGNMTNTMSSTPINITAQSGNPLYDKQIVQISAGDYHNMAIDSQGNLWAFGLGNAGQLGNKSATQINHTPINITAQSGNPLYGKQIVQVSAGGSRTMVIDSLGLLWAFGNNYYGQLGNMASGIYTNHTPINITAQAGNPLNGKQIAHVSTGGHTMAIDTQGNLWVFGYNSYGGLGNMTTTMSSTPINITAQSGNPLNSKQIVRVSAGESYAVAVDSQGNLWAFGYNGHGQLGNMTTADTNSTPLNLTAQPGNPLNDSRFGRMQVSAGGSHSITIDNTGNLWAFGYNSYGQLGNMSATSTGTPINITAQPGNPLNGKQIVQVSAGTYHTMAIDSLGLLWAFGRNNYGQLGNMSTTDSSTPINLTAQPGNPLNGKQIVQVSAGESHTMAIDSQGNLWAFGDNTFGQLGNMSTTNSSTPVNITTQTGNPLYNRQIVQVSAGTYHTMAIDSLGLLWAFGYNYNGQLGNMTTSGTNANSTPINITAQAGNPLNGKQIVQVTVGYLHTMAIDSLGLLWAWGDNDFGRLGNMSTTESSTPINITAQPGNPLNGKQIVQVSTVYAHTMAIDSLGLLWAFGNNGLGQLGNMSTNATNSIPINITTQAGNPLKSKQIVQVSVGWNHTMAIDTAGNIWAFGSGSVGQLGNMSTASINSTPINIQIPPQIAKATATIAGSSNASILARTNFATGWGSATASGGTVTTWTPNFLASPDVKRNDDTQAGRVRYEFDASGVNKIETLAINGISVDLTSEIPLSLWNNTLYLRTIFANYGRRLIVEMDRINTDIVTLAVTTSRNVGHNFTYVGNSHISSRVKAGTNIESTSASYVFENLTWTGNTATTASTTITLTSRAPFEGVYLDVDINSYDTKTFVGSLAELLPGAELTGTMSSSYSDNIYTITITITGMGESTYNWWISTQEMYQVQHMLNAPAGATAVPNPAMISWVYSGSWAGYWDMFDSPGDIYGTFLGWFTHPTGGEQVYDASNLFQIAGNASGAVVFLYAHWA